MTKGAPRSILKAVGEGKPFDRSKDRYADPSVGFLMEQMEKRQLSVVRVTEKSGLSDNTFYNWRKGMVPSICNIRAALNTIGYDLVPRKMHDNAVD